MTRDDEPPTDEAAEEAAARLELIHVALKTHLADKTEDQQLAIETVVLKLMGDSYTEGYNDGQFDASRYRMD